ncbi:MAG: hypothetical protein JSV04_00170 [Candidatus Heimdallarchaeota archaeon]|nr:MAG: hypothetical protein JSV04_00170 [Candidatus Heimdallarchaeota archaeon]
MIPADDSLEFLIEHLKHMIQEQPDKKIEKISDLTEILSDFMATFLVVVDALISSSQRRFKSMDEKLEDFENLLLTSSVKGLSQLSEKPEVPETEMVEEIPSEVQKSIPTPSDISPIPSPVQVVTPPPPPPPPSHETVTENGVVVPEPPVITKEMTDNLEVEQLADLAFQQRKKTPPSPRPTPVRPTVSLKMELMQELKKKFGTKKPDPNE